MNPTLRALNRFGLGARPGEPARVRDPRAWLEAQLQGGPPLVEDPAAQQREAVTAGLADARRGAQASREERDRLREQVLEIRAAETRGALEARIASLRPFVERLVAFWSNHLCVSLVAGPRVVSLVGPYEREAIRPHVLGRFQDMVLASARHPAMLFYLDNADSIGPESPAGRASARRDRARGLNENYARELLELHTLGVDGGYTQNDVLELARALTGWSVGQEQGTGAEMAPAPRFLVTGAFGFRFFPNRHQPGDRTILGERYSQDGAAQGEAVIRDLCAHPSTARFVATKLVRHFVADEPPARAVDAVAAEFTRSGGDLARVARALIALPEAWDEGSRKLRTPQDWLVAALRALDAPRATTALARALTGLRQPIWAPPAPKGWGDARGEWSDPDSLMNRAELARTLAAGPGRRSEPAALLDLMDAAPDDPLRALAADASIDRAERVALALASPAFQWR